MAYVTKRKSALPDAKRDPEIGQLDSHRRLMGVSRLHYGSIWYRLAATHGSGPVYSMTSERNKNKTKQILAKIEFSPRWLGRRP